MSHWGRKQRSHEAQKSVLGDSFKISPSPTPARSHPNFPNVWPFPMAAVLAHFSISWKVLVALVCLNSSVCKFGRRRSEGARHRKEAQMFLFRAISQPVFLHTRPTVPQGRLETLATWNPKANNRRSSCRLLSCELISNWRKHRVLAKHLLTSRKTFRLYWVKQLVHRAQSVLFFPSGSVSPGSYTESGHGF